MDKKKLLLVGGSHADIPIIEAAQARGFYVVTTGNKPDDFGHKYSDEYVCADFSNKEAIFDLAKGLNIDAICPSANDFAMFSAAYAAERLGLPGYDFSENIEIIHHKDKYREFCKDNEIKSPFAKGFDSKEEAIEFVKSQKLPLMVKSVDLTGGKGVKKVLSIKEAEGAIESSFLISKSKRIVIEEFIEGSRHGMSSIVKNGKIIFSFFDDEYYHANNYLVSAASTPPNIGVVLKKGLIEECEKICDILNLVDGIFHVQFILSEDGPVIIEICRRPPGDLYVKFVSVATGIDYANTILSSFIGENLEDSYNLDKQIFCARHCMMANRNGVLKDIRFDESIAENLTEIFWLNDKGAKVEDFMTFKAGIAFLKFDSYDEMIYKSSRMQKLISLQVD